MAMEDTLPLVCTVPNKRPSRPTQETLLEAARVVVDAMVKDGIDLGTDLQGCAEDIADVGRYGEEDGYRLAKSLEDRHHWECDMQIAEALEQYGYEVSKRVDAAVRLWATENPMNPLAIGTSVIWRGKIATVAGVAEHAFHSYLLKNDECPANSHWVVAFEDVTLP